MNNDYYQKYLKYKFKYIDNKNNLKGGNINLADKIVKNNLKCFIIHLVNNKLHDIFQNLSVQFEENSRFFNKSSQDNINKFIENNIKFDIIIINGELKKQMASKAMGKITLELLNSLKKILNDNGEIYFKKNFKGTTKLNDHDFINNKITDKLLYPVHNINTPNIKIYEDFIVQHNLILLNSIFKTTFNYDSFPCKFLSTQSDNIEPCYYYKCINTNINPTINLINHSITNNIECFKKHIENTNINLQFEKLKSEYSELQNKCINNHDSINNYTSYIILNIKNRKFMPNNINLIIGADHRLELVNKFNMFGLKPDSWIGLGNANDIENFNSDIYIKDFNKVEYLKNITIEHPYFENFFQTIFYDIGTVYFVNSSIFCFGYYKNLLRKYGSMYIPLEQNSGNITSDIVKKINEYEELNLPNDKNTFLKYWNGIFKPNNLNDVILLVGANLPRSIVANEYKNQIYTLLQKAIVEYNTILLELIFDDVKYETDFKNYPIPYGNFYPDGTIATDYSSHCIGFFRCSKYNNDLFDPSIINFGFIINHFNEIGNKYANML